MAAPPDEHEGDAELFRRIAARDAAAFATVQRRYARAVHGLALRQLHDLDRAAAATRRAFAAIWHAAADDRAAHGDDTRWLFAVVQAAIVEEHTHAVASDDAWQAFRIHVAVAKLPEDERVPLELAYWGGRDASEIGDLLNLPVATVELRIRNGLQHLARLVDATD